MVSSNREPEPPTTSQPPVYSSLELHTPTTLLASPHLPALFNLINHAFDHSHNKAGSSHLPPSEKARLQTHAQLGDEVGHDGFILIMLQKPTSSSPSSPAGTSTEGFLSPSGHRIIGTASAKPYHPSHPIASSIDSSNATHLFKRPPPPKPHPEAENTSTPQWELLAMVVDPSLQGHGLATQLTNLTIDEIKSRCVSNPHPPPSTPSEASPNDKLTLLLSTMKDLNENYYLKRGWTTTDTRSFPPGTMGSRDGFSVVEMCKTIAL